MAYNPEILLGRITKISGFEGAVTVKLEKIFIENIPDMESVFLEIEGRPVPFFITDINYNGGDVLRLQFKDYESEAKIGGFIGCRVFLTSAPSSQSAENSILLLAIQFIQLINCWVLSQLLHRSAVNGF